MRAWLLVILTGGSVIFVEAQDWDRADRTTRRLAPSVFLELPAAVRLDLEQRGCTIPQPFTAKRPENVINGRFMSPDQIDWAVLCSRERTSSILVFPGGAPSAVIDIATELDRHSLQVIDGGREIGYSRALGVADAEYIRDHYQRYGGPKPPPLDHDGINDMFIEKGSVVWYWYRGRWLRLTGAD